MTKMLTIVQVNDTHANLYPYGDALYTPHGFEIRRMGGYPRIMAKIKEYQERYPGEVLVLDNGDTFHGTAEAVETKGEVMIPYVKALGIEGMTFHWDSAYSPKHLKNMEESLGYPILANNVYHEGTKDPFFTPSTIIEKNGLKIGVIGIASNIIRTNMPAKFWEGADFTDGIEETRVEVKKIRDQGVDLVVILSHLGYPQDIELLKQVDGIDLALSGHTHNRIRQPQEFNGATIIQSGALSSSIGFLRLGIDKGIQSIEHELVVLDDRVDEDPEMLKMLEEDPVLKDYREKLDVPVGSTKLDLHRASSFYGTMDYLLLDAMQAATGLPIVFSNGWRYGGASPKGKLHRRDLYAITPMNPGIRTADLTGAELWDMLEDNLESTFSSEPFKQMGGYIKRNAGLKVYFKLENPYGQRIQRIFVGEDDIDLGKTYTVAYVTRQAVPETVGRNHQDTGLHAIEAMEALLEKGPYDREDLESYIPV